MIDELRRVAHESGFTGVVRADVAGETVVCEAIGMADRAHGVPHTTDTCIGIASGAKGLTALMVMRLVETGALELDAPVRPLLGDDLPLIEERVTVGHLLAHRSGIRDYFDEETAGAITDYALPIAVHRLVRTEDYLSVLDGHPTKFEPGTAFSYCNGGYVVLALVAERAAGRPFHELVDALVCRPAAMARTGWLRLDELPGTAAVGYLDRTGLRTNTLHLPVRGTGDGGVYSTAADVHAMWDAFFGGRIVAPTTVELMVTPRSDVPSEDRRYGLGFWLERTGDGVVLEGYDAGASFHSVHRPGSATTWTVLSNWSDGAWPVVRYLSDCF